MQIEAEEEEEERRVRELSIFAEYDEDLQLRSGIGTKALSLFLLFLHLICKGLWLTEPDFGSRRGK